MYILLKFKIQIFIIQIIKLMDSNQHQQNQNQNNQNNQNNINNQQEHDLQYRIDQFDSTNTKRPYFYTR